MKRKYTIVAGSLILVIIALSVANYYKPQNIYEMYNFDGYIKIDKIVFHQNLEDSGVDIIINDDQNKIICDILQDTSFRKTLWSYHEKEPKRFDIYFSTIHSDGSFYIGNLIYSYPNGKIFNTNEHFSATLCKENLNGNLYQQLERILFEEE